MPLDTAATTVGQLVLGKRRDNRSMNPEEHGAIAERSRELRDLRRLDGDGFLPKSSRSLTKTRAPRRTNFSTLSPLVVLSIMH